MSQQPPGPGHGPGQPWSPAGPQPWDAPRQQPQHPVAPPQQPYQPITPVSAVTKPSIWRIAVGVWLGLIMFFVTMLILAIALGSAFESEFRDSFDSNTGGTSSPDDPFDFSN